MCLAKRGEKECSGVDKSSQIFINFLKFFLWQKVAKMTGRIRRKKNDIAITCYYPYEEVAQSHSC